MKIHHSLILVLLPLALSTATAVTLYEIPQPLIISQTDPAANLLQRELNAGKLATEWADAFKTFKRSGSSNNIQIITSNNGIDFSHSNVWAVTRSGNLLVITSRIGNRDFRAFIAPAQIVTLREVQP